MYDTTKNPLPDMFVVKLAAIPTGGGMTVAYAGYGGGAGGAGTRTTRPSAER